VSSHDFFSHGRQTRILAPIVLWVRVWVFKNPLHALCKNNTKNVIIERFMLRNVFLFIAIMGLMMIGFSSCDNREEVVPVFDISSSKIKRSQEVHSLSTINWISHPNWTLGGFLWESQTRTYSVSSGKRYRLRFTNTSGTRTIGITINGLLVFNAPPTTCTQWYEFTASSSSVRVGFAQPYPSGTVEFQYQP
ncbi:MAG: hypothetical protein NZL83_04900, partial [Candidatus Absconditabacterales bacterium]|nr:hypothetical protein [Candidatus Absconditabacterales bacterium]